MMDDDDEDDEITAAVAAGKRVNAGLNVDSKDDYYNSMSSKKNLDDDDALLEQGMYNELKRKYDDLLAESREHSKTVNF